MTRRVSLRLRMPGRFPLLYLPPHEQHVARLILNVGLPNITKAPHRLLPVALRTPSLFIR